jgi:hypothetical protein
MFRRSAFSLSVACRGRMLDAHLERLRQAEPDLQMSLSILAGAKVIE